MVGPEYCLNKLAEIFHVTGINRKNLLNAFPFFDGYMHHNDLYKYFAVIRNVRLTSLQL